MADIAQAMRYKIDVKNGLVKQPMAGVLMRGDNNANRIIADLVDGDKTVSLDGVTVTGKFFRGGDGIKIPLEGSASGNEATVLLDEHCYAVDGYFEASIKLTTGGATRTILTITGQVVSDGEGGILDIENVIPSVADIVAQYQSMQEVTAQTEAARDAANAAAGAANTAADNAEEKARAAETAAQGASGWANAAMTADLLPAGSDPTVVITTAEDGRKIITLGIPKGDTGATPKISVEVSTGAAGSEASVSVSGTAEKPVIHLTIPRGATGAIENLTINGKPVESGTITLNAEDVGARPDDWMPSAQDVGALGKDDTAADSDKLGGKSPGEYASAASVSAHEESLGDAWASDTDYAIGSFCIHDSRLYKCIADHHSGSAFGADKWTATSVANEITKIKTLQVVGTTDADGDLQIGDLTSANHVILAAHPIRTYGSSTYTELFACAISMTSDGASYYVKCINDDLTNVESQKVAVTIYYVERSAVN